MTFIGSVFGDGTWYHTWSELFPLKRNGAAPVHNSNYHIDNQTQRFLERYFDAFYMADVGGEPFNDICILRHSNTLCTVGLAPAHHLFMGCKEQPLSVDGNSLTPHNLLGVDFKISDKVHRLHNKMSGRRKHGGQTVGRAPNVLAFAVCDRSVRHKLMCGIPGRLIEVNKGLSYPPIHSGEGLSSSSDFVSVSFPTPLAPLFDSAGLTEQQVGPYLCIIAPSRLPRASRKRPFTKSSAEPSDTSCRVEPNHPECSREDGSESDCSDSDNDSLSYLRRLTGERVLNWVQYSKLRGL
ncbi:hypothetical protein X801_09049, partial [Opisthorchis viverrini]